MKARPCYRMVVSLFFVCLSISSVHAQSVLPDIQAVSQDGLTVISWFNKYEGLKTIAVERSSDSLYNFKTIGYVKDLSKGAQRFLDGHPLPGNNWYRLNIVFSSDLSWYSNRTKIFIDSAQLMKQRVLPPNDSLQKMLDALPLSATPDEIGTFTYVRSQFVFTNPFTGHINVELPENADKKSLFSLQFFDNDDRQVLNIPQVREPVIIIDKRNFQKKGLYKFKLFKNKELLESGYVTIY